MNCLELLLSSSTRWTKALAEELCESNKIWNDSPAGVLGWRFPVQGEYSHIVKLNWKIQDQLIYLSQSLGRFQESCSREDWFVVEHTLDHLRMLVSKLKCHTEDQLEEHIQSSYTSQLQAA